uniref:Uncharacterized protein n=1 Tax=Avena sativa TaxID=4498 RepID=A0ACD6AMG7_AVESA
MDASAVAGCFRDKSILITGSTGFLGKLLVEKILRVQPDVKKLYLLVRAPDAASAEQRVLSKVIGMDLFNVLREKYGLPGFQSFIQEKVIALAGDIDYENFGLDDCQADVLSKEIDIIINGAATTSFYERYDVALASNALGPRNACEFAKKCPNMKLLLHVSTAFVAGTQEGLLLEKAFKNGETLRAGYSVDIEAELELVERVKSELRAAKGGSIEQLEKSTMKELGLKRACHFGWPNVYTFTKAIGEILLGQQRGNLPVVIIRPTMVTSTYQDPFAGWIEGAKTIDALIVAYDDQAFPCFIGDRNNIIDVIPADIVINAAMVAMAVHWNEKEQVIYHMLHIMSLLLCGLFSRRYNNLNRRFKFLMLLASLYAPYAFFDGRFDDTNYMSLRTKAKMENGDDSIFNFDPKKVDWHSYLTEVHVPAVIKYTRREKAGR